MRGSSVSITTNKPCDYESKLDVDPVRWSPQSDDEKTHTEAPWPWCIWFIEPGNVEWDGAGSVDASPGPARPLCPGSTKTGQDHLSQ